MGLNDTPVGERVHIGFFGIRNAGKSSVVNAVTGQDLAVVSDTLGTTTDLVTKNMELLPLGPVTIVDTPGIDDEGELGSMRVGRARRALSVCDIAVLVVDGTRGLQPADEELIASFAARRVPYVIAWNKTDLPMVRAVSDEAATIRVSAQTGEGIWELKERIAHLAEGASQRRALIADLLQEGDAVVLVIPIDESAPKGRIILPQQMVLRDCLDVHASALCCQPEELAGLLAKLDRPPRMVVTDSQAFAQVAPVVPDDVPLTSFSILMARYKGDLMALAQGAEALGGLSDGDHVLICEACTHHRQCEDIGTVKIPRGIQVHSGAELEFSFTAGGDFPEDLSAYKLVVHCGGCMINAKQMTNRIAIAQDAGVPITNYGMALAQMQGILERSLDALA